MKIGTYTNNGGMECNYIKYLKPKSKLVSLNNQNGFIKDKIYTVDHLSSWDFEVVAFVADETSALTIAKPEQFRLYDISDERDIKLNEILISDISISK